MRRPVLIVAVAAAVGALAACTDHSGAQSPADGSSPSSTLSPSPDRTVAEGPGVTSAPPLPTVSPPLTPVPTPVPSLTLPPRPTGSGGPIVPGPTTPDPD